MKSFKSFILEAETFEFPLAHYTPDGKHEAFSSKNLFDPNFRAQVNVNLLRHTDVAFANPHTALNCVSKVLAHCGVIVPKAQWPAVDGGELVWRIAQNGDVHGYEPLRGSTGDANEGNFVFLYFEYQCNEVGRYVCYAEICDVDGLESLLSEEVEEKDEKVEEPTTSDATLARLKTNIVGEDKQHPGEGTHEQRSKIAKKARKGENVGHGNFDKVANKAAKEYGSKEAGEKVAAAAMWKNKKLREDVEVIPHKIGDKLIGHVARDHSAPDHNSWAFFHKESGHADSAHSKENAIQKLEAFHAKRSRYVNEHLGASATTKDYIDDFEKSKNPRFKGKSKEKRRQMAIAASYKGK